MPIDWKSPDSFKRLLAATFASNDMKLDYRRIASFYGEGATYDAIEGRFRIIRREAQKLQAEVETGVRPAAPARGTKSNGGSATATPKKQRSENSIGGKDKVITGRVGKSASSGTSPTKASKGGQHVNAVSMRNNGPNSGMSKAEGENAVFVDGASDDCMAFGGLTMDSFHNNVSFADVDAPADDDWLNLDTGV